MTFCKCGLILLLILVNLTTSLSTFTAKWEATYACTGKIWWNGGHLFGKAFTFILQGTNSLLNSACGPRSRQGDSETRQSALIYVIPPSKHS